MKAVLLFSLLAILIWQASASGHKHHEGFYVGGLRIGIPLPKIKLQFADILDLSHGIGGGGGLSFGGHGGGGHGGGHGGIGFGISLGGHGGGHHG